MPTINLHGEYFPSYVYRGDTSGVFPANYDGRCNDCGGVIRRGEKVQYLYNQFGHPIGGEIAGTLYRICTRQMRDISLNCGGSVTDINVRVRAAETALSELYARQEAIKKFGKDTEYPDGAVILSRALGSYWRAAVKVSGNCWHYSGNSSTGYRPSLPFDRLVEEYLVDATEVWFGTNWDRLK
jgi:hypothetical protein